MFENLHNNKKKKLWEIKSFCVGCVVRNGNPSQQLGGRVWSSLLEIKSLRCIESQGRGLRPQPQGVPAFRGQAAAEGPWGERRRRGKREVAGSW